MSAIPPDLADLRRHIDEIDNRMQDLLIERAEVVAQVAASKKDGDVAFYQPGREAQILRRLAGRHRGALPFAAVVRIWREMLAATVRLETPFPIAVFAPAGAPGLRDLARDHFGSHAPMSIFPAICQVIGAVSEGRAAVGVVPMPQEDEPDPWWPRLLVPGGGAPGVLARLPFGPPGNANIDSGEAFVIGRGAQLETGADRTLFATEWAADIGRTRVQRLLSSAGLACTFFASWRRHEATLSLIETEGFVPLSDPRLAEFGAQFGAGLSRLLPFGGYALPLPEAASTHSAAKG